MLFSSSSRNGAPAREGIDTFPYLHHMDIHFSAVEMEFQPERALIHTWFSRSAGSNNEVQAREGIYKSRAGKPTVLTVGVCQI